MNFDNIVLKILENNSVSKNERIQALKSLGKTKFFKAVIAFMGIFPFPVPYVYDILSFQAFGLEEGTIKAHKHISDVFGVKERLEPEIEISSENDLGIITTDINNLIFVVGVKNQFFSKIPTDFDREDYGGDVDWIAEELTSLYNEGVTVHKIKL